jgi:hypothetical protein
VDSIGILCNEMIIVPVDTLVPREPGYLLPVPGLKFMKFCHYFVIGQGLDDAQ